ncbi:hypothetical protein GEMRC1_007543 [Eukaryota sp. GEM-RC1]
MTGLKSSNFELKQQLNHLKTQLDDQASRHRLSLLNLQKENDSLHSRISDLKQNHNGDVPVRKSQQKKKLRATSNAPRTQRPSSVKRRIKQYGDKNTKNLCFRQHVILEWKCGIDIPKNRQWTDPKFCMISLQETFLFLTNMLEQ